MKNKILILTLSLAALAFAGCGHNAVTYVDGFEFNLAQVLVYRSGKILNANVKEKSDVIVETNNNGTQEQTDNKTVLTLKTGDQITGYAVDLEEVKTDKASAE